MHHPFACGGGGVAGMVLQVYNLLYRVGGRIGTHWPSAYEAVGVSAYRQGTDRQKPFGGYYVDNNGGGAVYVVLLAVSNGVFASR